MKHFIHSGGFGDIIYSLPVVREMGGGVFHLVHDPGVLHGMLPERARQIVRLLLSQPYISGVELDMPTIRGVVLTREESYGGWRRLAECGIVNLNAIRVNGGIVDLGRDHLTLCHSRMFGLPNGLMDQPWLTIPRNPAQSQLSPSVVIARSSRYHNPAFPWPKILRTYKDHVHFVGTAAEHEAFQAAFGVEVHHFCTPTLYDVAELIAQATLFIGNQSSPLAIAEGLGANILCEVCPYCPNCNLTRPNFVAGWDGNVALPALEELPRTIGGAAQPSPLLPRFADDPISR